MATKIIVIDGYIGAYAFSKQFIRNELSGNSKNPITAKISSLGGAVDHALNIYDQFVEHGNVTAELSAFVASSATLISLGAKTVRMNENSFYLIHKAMNWVDEWGTMNEDEIEELISKLEKQKQQLAKITLQLAKMYVKKTGKTLEDIINLMKEETWLTAEEAMEWGFVDEIFAPDNVVNYLDDLQMVAMITSNGFPSPKRKHESVTQNQDSQTIEIDEEGFFERFWNRFSSKKNSETEISNKITIMEQYQHVNDALGVENLEASDEHVSLNAEQLQQLNNKYAAHSQAVKDAQTAQSNAEEAQRVAEAAQTSAEQERNTARTDLESATSAFDELDETVANAEGYEAKVEAVRTLLAAKPGAKPEGNLETEDPEKQNKSFDGFSAEEKELTENL